MKMWLLWLIVVFWWVVYDGLGWCVWCVSSLVSVVFVLLVMGFLLGVLNWLFVIR